ncbi:MAG: phenylalanine--tRNA ligase subunit alpha [Bacteroidota bacterium]
MIDKIQDYLKHVESFVAQNADELEQFRIEYLGSKRGLVKQLYADFKAVADAQKPLVGKLLNQLKDTIQETLDTQKSKLEQDAGLDPGLDLTRPASPINLGSRHPVAMVRNEIVDIFTRLGFTVAEGPEVEDDWHVFSALNFPPEHPARDMQDTFFINTDPEILLRTHTSSVQVRAMEHQKPPLRIVMPGRVFRNEAVSARSHCIFHQVEGLYIDKDVSFADLKQTLLYFAKEFFGADTQIRLRPSYFPFTEPSAEVDVSCSLCGGKGCNVCKYSGWLEILGCGMIDPNVLEASGIDSKIYSGFAFGLGIERIAMMRFGVKDIRLFFENDVRFLSQFSRV